MNAPIKWTKPEWKKPPREVRAFACSVCGKQFPTRNDPNLAMCCVCPVCRGPSGKSEPGCRTCTRCELKQQVASNEQQFERFKESHAQLLARIAELEARDG